MSIDFLHPAAAAWFTKTFGAPTDAQRLGWPPIAAGKSTLLLAPTGSGKTLAAFLAAIHRLAFSEEPKKKSRLRVLYVSPLKALGVDVEKNLEMPIAGIEKSAAEHGARFRKIAVGVRSGDTPSAERARLGRTPPDILITTPESLYLILTSNAKETLASVETVIVDEIHSMVATKRGAHLFLSLERLEELRGTDAPPLQRIGLSATQRPLEEVARLLGGFDGEGKPRPIAIVDAGRKKPLELSIEVPVEDMAALEGDEEKPRSIWPSIHPRLIELIRAHKSTLIFVNNRALAERLSAALCETAKEPIALAHHGSIAKDTRRMIEGRLKSGELPALVATSSLELGIDMGAIDLVVQIEAPPSVASGLQRIGRAGHQVGAVSKGVVFPKFRGDLLACAAAVDRMHSGLVEETFFPKNPLDVLAQQLVAIVSASGSIGVDHLYGMVRRAANFAELPRKSFDGVLDMLSGRYPSDRFAELRPRITWDRRANVLMPRQGAKRIAVVNGGTIPDRGLFGVFLSEEGGAKSRRVGELDEEMVFESKPGDVFLLGASSWRIEEIDHDRVIVSPAPGEPGRMPFWRGDGPGRPFELGRAIGALARELAAMPKEAAEKLLIEDRKLDRRAAENLLAYLAAQREATGALPTDETVVIERCLDEVGDWRICVLTPFGSRVHAPWATAVRMRLAHLSGRDVDLMWNDDGIAFRLPAADEPPETALFLPPSDEVRALVVRGLGETAMFAGRFREAAGRSLLLPKRRPGQRSPLWATRRRAADLLAVAAHYPDFPVVLEAYRECLSDDFDLDALEQILKQIESRQIQVASVRSKAPSPFASALLFTYVGNFMYEVDAPLAERRAQALTIDHAQLRELLGEGELRELLDPSAIEEHTRRLQHLDGYFPIRHADGLNDALLSLGDLSPSEIALRAEDREHVPSWIAALVDAGRAVELPIGGDRRLVAVEDAARYRDALGVKLPAGLPAELLKPVEGALTELVARFARTHGPFVPSQVALRFGAGVAAIELALAELAKEERALAGEFLPEGTTKEWCDPEVLRAIKRISLAKLKKLVEPQAPAVLGRFLVEHQGVAMPRAGLDALLDAIELLQGAPLPASDLEAEILPARIANYGSSMLDELCAAGEIVWRGIERIGDKDARIALYLTDDYARLAPVRTKIEGPLADQVRSLLEARGAQFFSELIARTRAFPNDLVELLWSMSFAGEITNDTLAPLRSSRGGVRTRRRGPPGSEGRWSLLPDPEATATPTERRTALARQLLSRYGVLTREAVDAEGIAGGFSSIYPVLKAMEERGQARRGYFLADLGATQFASPGADDRLRALAGAPIGAPIILAATDPANPYGACVPWPAHEGARPQRAAGAQVVLHGGSLLGWLGRTETSLLTFGGDANALAEALARWARSGERNAVMIEKVDGEPAADTRWAKIFEAVGFRKISRGYLIRRFD
jgi:ATP-dependent helicase Lhr and Lhr-like helicase